MLRAGCPSIHFWMPYHGRYGRFPAYSAPFRTVLGYQATHVDVEFYDCFYRPEALTATQIMEVTMSTTNALPMTTAAGEALSASFERFASVCTIAARAKRLKLKVTRLYAL